MCLTLGVWVIDVRCIYYIIILYLILLLLFIIHIIPYTILSSSSILLPFLSSSPLLFCSSLLFFSSSSPHSFYTCRHLHILIYIILLSPIPNLASVPLPFLIIPILILILHSQNTCRHLHILIYIPPQSDNLTPHVLSEWMVEVCRFEYLGIRFRVLV